MVLPSSLVSQQSYLVVTSRVYVGFEEKSNKKGEYDRAYD
jgi:hypothetical protein